MPPVSQRYRDARRRHIIDSARRCYARSGFHATSMQDVFTESGLSAGAVYGYFASKDDLIGGIIEEVLDEIDVALQNLTDATGPSSLDDALAAVFQALDHPELARLAVQVWAEAGHNPQLNARLTDYYRRMRVRFTALVQHHQRDGTLTPDGNASHLAQVLTALGPAFLLQRALLHDVNADTFTSGLRGLLAGRVAVQS